MKKYVFKVAAREKFGKMDFFKLITATGKFMFVAVALMPDNKVGDTVVREADL